MKSAIAGLTLLLTQKMHGPMNLLLISVVVKQSPFAYGCMLYYSYSR